MIYLKSLREIDYIRDACKVVAQTLEYLKKYIKPGISTIELDMIAEDFILSKGAKSAFKGYSQGGSYNFPGATCISIDEEVVHGIPSKRILAEGEIVSVDVGVNKNGYFGDAAYSYAIGKISDEKKRLMEATEKSLYLAIEQAVVKNRVHDISFAIQNFIETNGFSVVKELHGHGVGKYLHEDPSIPNYGRKGTGSKIKNNMTLAIEPMVNYGESDVYCAYDGWTVITKDNLPSAHFEHTVLINEKNPEILTVC